MVLWLPSSRLVDAGWTLRVETQVIQLTHVTRLLAFKGSTALNRVADAIILFNLRLQRWQLHLRCLLSLMSNLLFAGLPQDRRCRHCSIS